MKKYEIRIKRPLTNIMTVESHIYDMLAAIEILGFKTTDQKYGQCITFRTELSIIKQQIILQFCRGKAEEFGYTPEYITLHEAPMLFDFEDYMNTNLNGMAQEAGMDNELSDVDLIIDQVLYGESMEFKQQARKAVADLWKEKIEHWLHINSLVR